MSTLTFQITTGEAVSTLSVLRDGGVYHTLVSCDKEVLRNAVGMSAQNVADAWNTMIIAAIISEEMRQYAKEKRG